MSRNYIPEKIGLMFDPAVEGGKVAEVFEDEMARLFWMVFRPFKWPHCAWFEYNCLFAAESLKENGVPRNIKELGELVRSHFYHTSFPEGVEQDVFLEELFPYVKREKVLNYQTAPEIKTQSLKTP